MAWRQHDPVRGNSVVNVGTLQTIRRPQPISTFWRWSFMLADTTEPAAALSRWSSRGQSGPDAVSWLKEALTIRKHQSRYCTASLSMWHPCSSAYSTQQYSSTAVQHTSVQQYNSTAHISTTVQHTSVQHTAVQHTSVQQYSSTAHISTAVQHTSV